jgi:hypothetical protein
VPATSERCDLRGCAAPAAAAYVVAFDGALPVRYVSLCSDHARDMLIQQGCALPEAVLAFLDGRARER